MALVGLLTLLSLLSPNNAGLLKAWVDALKYVTGWGVFVLPLGLLTGGMWLVLRLWLLSKAWKLIMVLK